MQNASEAVEHPHQNTKAFFELLLAKFRSIEVQAKIDELVKKHSTITDRRRMLATKWYSVELVRPKNDDVFPHDTAFALQLHYLPMMGGDPITIACCGFDLVANRPGHDLKADKLQITQLEAMLPNPGAQNAHMVKDICWEDVLVGTAISLSQALALRTVSLSIAEYNDYYRNMVGMYNSAQREEFQAHNARFEKWFNQTAERLGFERKVPWYFYDLDTAS